MSLGFTFAFGAHSISQEFAGFSPSWFTRGIVEYYEGVGHCIIMCHSKHNKEINNLHLHK